LWQAFGERFRARVRLPLVAPDESEPEPDFAVVDGDLDRGAHPSFAHLVVEVTDSSSIDLVRKARVYARAGIPSYWVVHVRRREVAVHTGPRDEGYARVEWVGFDAPLDMLGLTVTMDDLLA
jgi:Uma2 family endonuclease